MVGNGVTVRERGGKEGETVAKLTAVAVGVETGSGTRWRRRIRRRWWSEPEEGNGDVAAMQGFGRERERARESRGRVRESRRSYLALTW